MNFGFGRTSGREPEGIFGDRDRQSAEGVGRGEAQPFLGVLLFVVLLLVLFFLIHPGEPSASAANAKTCQACASNPRLSFSPGGPHISCSSKYDNVVFCRFEPTLPLIDHFGPPIASCQPPTAKRQKMKIRLKIHKTKSTKMLSLGDVDAA